jgi:hypothetical protein
MLNARIFIKDFEHIWKIHDKEFWEYLTFNIIYNYIVFNDNRGYGVLEHLTSYLGAYALIYYKLEVMYNNYYVAPLLWPSVGVKPNTWKSRELESSGTPEFSELHSKGKNTSHWDVLGVIGKVLKRKYRKWPCIDHLDICSPSYGQKKGRESNWQFDSRPLKVGNRPLPDIRFGIAIWR